MKIDYESLRDEYQGLSHDEIKRTTDSLNKKLHDLHNHLVKIQAPNMKVKISIFAPCHDFWRFWSPCQFV